MTDQEKLRIAKAAANDLLYWSDSMFLMALGDGADLDNNLIRERNEKALLDAGLLDEENQEQRRIRMSKVVIA